tara:strand:- start:50 stop:553 length:504 start_codon:yes stop_codon:yes gene_type:complete
MANPLYGQNKADNAIDNATGQIVHIKPLADGTGVPDAETVILTAADAGNAYFVDFGTNTATFRLPAVADSIGAEFTFIADINSDAENSKALIAFSDATDEFIIGTVLAAGSIFDTSVADDQLMLIGSGGAIGGGDRFKVKCDGIHWYVLEGVALTASAFAAGTITRS